jgi:hypothetical protein
MFTLGVRPRLKRKHANNDGGRKWVANRGATSARLNYVSFDAPKAQGESVIAEGKA